MHQPQPVPLAIPDHLGQARAKLHRWMKVKVQTQIVPQLEAMCEMILFVVCLAEAECCWAWAMKGLKWRHERWNIIHEHACKMRNLGWQDQRRQVHWEICQAVQKFDLAKHAMRKAGVVVLCTCQEYGIEGTCCHMGVGGCQVPGIEVIRGTRNCRVSHPAQPILPSSSSTQAMCAEHQSQQQTAQICPYRRKPLAQKLFVIAHMADELPEHGMQPRTCTDFQWSDTCS